MWWPLLTQSYSTPLSVRCTANTNNGLIKWQPYYCLSTFEPKPHGWTWIVVRRHTVYGICFKKGRWFNSCSFFSTAIKKWCRILWAIFKKSCHAVWHSRQQHECQFIHGKLTFMKIILKCTLLFAHNHFLMASVLIEHEWWIWAISYSVLIGPHDTHNSQTPGSSQCLILCDI